MEIEQLLTHTKSARKTLDLSAPADLEVIASCLRIALQAPNGTNSQGWHWVVVADGTRRAEVAALYREAYLSMTGGLIADALPGETDFGKLMSSTEWLVEHLAEVPFFVIPCFQPYLPRHEGDELFFASTLYGSIFPAVWTFQLALRTHGYGTCITTLHLLRAREVGALLGIPDDYVQGCLLPVAPLRDARFSSPASRKPLADVTSVDHWTGPPLST